VEGFEAFEGSAPKVMHHDQHRTRRPVIRDVAGA
jgi:hypothetical protein